MSCLISEYCLKLFYGHVGKYSNRPEFPRIICYALQCSLLYFIGNAFKFYHSPDLGQKSGMKNGNIVFFSFRAFYNFIVPNNILAEGRITLRKSYFLGS